jgi:SAM-dependent methyltransferase
MGDDDSDVPYGENYHDAAEAAAWAEAALRKRPFRPQLFDLFVAAVNARGGKGVRVLELGSGPGFLAEQILSRCEAVTQYSLLDFSEPMLNQSRERLGRYAARTEFLRADFKSENWGREAGGTFDFVLSLQAVHELRHKRHAPRLFAQVRQLMAPGGSLLVCDYLPEFAHTPRHRVLYMSTDEYLSVLAAAGFPEPEVLWSEHQMALYRANVPGTD